MILVELFLLKAHENSYCYGSTKGKEMAYRRCAWKTLGRIATHIADLLRGKGKADFTPHIDNGDGVIVINSSEIHMTGTKWSQKKYYSHSGYGRNTGKTAEKLHESDPSALLQKAVLG